LAGSLDLFMDWPDLHASLTAGAAPHQVIHLSLLGKRVAGAKLAQSVVFPARTPEPFHGKLERLAVELKEWRVRGFRALLAVQSLERAKRLQSGLTDHGLSAVVTDTAADQLKPGNVVVAPGALSCGGEFPNQKLVILSDLEIFGRPRRRRLRPVEEGVRLAAFADLRVGDYVVHTNHGIGQYLGVETKEVGGVHRDYCILRYSGEDRLFVPTEQVNQLQRYIGVEGVPPKLSRLGGTEWTRVKNRVKESVRDLAESLLKVYAEREDVQGHAFAPDTTWQGEFEETFP
jgi:transcription-repair coupling factor (superfamily II helicase)